MRSAPRKNAIFIAIALFVLGLLSGAARPRKRNLRDAEQALLGN
jgi:hypothetical protein